MIRIAKIEDAARIREIYRPAIESAAISFEVNVPTVDQMRQRIVECLPDYPWLVEEQSGQVRGYAYARRFHTRAAYRWTVETTVYVDQRCFRQGIGRELYRALFVILKQQGFCKAIAGITLPNSASVALHEFLGFRQTGLIPAVGYKLGKWHDVGEWTLSLVDPLPTDPDEPTPFTAVEQHYRGDLTSLL